MSDSLETIDFKNERNNLKSERKKYNRINLDYKQLTKSIDTVRNFIKKDKKIQKNNILSPNKIYNNEQNQSQNNSLMTTILSTNDFLSRNELKGLKIKMDNLKKEKNKIIENEKKVNNDILNLEKQLSEIINKKDKMNKELEDNLSNKESLEEIIKNKINEINNGSLSLRLSNIEIQINEIKITEKIKFQDSLINLLENLGVKVQNKIKEKIKEVLDKVYKKNQENKIHILSSFLNPINDFFYDILYDKFKEEETIKYLIKYILKIQIINAKIEQNIYFIKREYKQQKYNIKLKKEDLQKYLLELERNKSILNEKINEINKKKELINKKIFNSITKKNIEKEIDDELEKQMSNNNTSNKKTNISMNKSESVVDISTISLNTTCRKNIFSCSNNYSLRKSKSNASFFSPKNNNKKIDYSLYDNYSNDSNVILKYDNSKKIETFCYFRLIKIGEVIFDPLNHYDISPEKLGYLQGFISINFENNLLVFKPKINQNEINMKIIEEELKIDLKKINNVICDMKDIIQIHQIYLKNNEKAKIVENKDSKNEISNILNLNKLINQREIRKIKMNNTDKIKAALSHYFIISIIFNYVKRIECIFINYDDFIKWLQEILNIVEENKKNKQFESFRENKFYKIIKKSNKTQRTKSFNPRTPKSNLNGKRKKKQV